MGKAVVFLKDGGLGFLSLIFINVIDSTFKKGFFVICFSPDGKAFFSDLFSVLIVKDFFPICFSPVDKGFFCWSVSVLMVYSIIDFIPH